MTAPALYPLKLERFLSPRLWGGTRLHTFLGLGTLETEEPLGESWQVYADNQVLHGALTGKTLSHIARDYGPSFLGRVNSRRYGNRVPLLAKFIDAADKLSIQVHPDDDYASVHEASSGHLGKTEAWYILEAEADAHIIWGLRQQLDKASLKEAILEGELEPHLNHIPVQRGDVIYNPAGTIHAVGQGILLFEIQQSSDLTYRLYDYQRRDVQGNLRQLHIDKALEVADLSMGQTAKYPAKPLSEQKTELLRVKHFAMEHWELAGIQEETVFEASFEILTVIEGQALLSWQGQRYPLARGESLVLAATLGSYSLEGQASLLRCFVPEQV